MSEPSMFFPDSDDRAALADLLAWYADMGADEAIGDIAVDRLAAPLPEAGPAPEAQSRMAPSQTAPSQTAPVQTGETAASARAAYPAAARTQTAPAAPAPLADDRALAEEAAALAAAADSLDALRAAMAGFEGCPLKATAKSLVFADGTPQARVMFVGEAPGRDEDIQGLPFVGRAGQLLDRMLAAIGLDRHSAYIANIVPWRPPGNRTPTPSETAMCLPFLLRHIELAAPAYLVCLGGVAAKELFATTTGITRLRGQWRSFEPGALTGHPGLAAGRTVPAMATLHPAFLLRQPAQKRLAWQDFLSLKARLEDA